MGYAWPVVKFTPFVFEVRGHCRRDGGGVQRLNEGDFGDHERRSGSQLLSKHIKTLRCRPSERIFLQKTLQQTVLPAMHARTSQMTIATLNAGCEDDRLSKITIVSPRSPFQYDNRPSNFF